VTIKALFAIGSVVATATALNLVPMQAQAVELISNGDFSLNNLAANDALSGLTNTGADGLTTAATATNWVFAPASVNTDTNESLVWLAATGETYHTNLNILGGEGINNTYIHRLYGNCSLSLPGGGSGFFIASDGDSNYSSTFSQTLTGLIAGDTYKVSFYQAAGQQVDTGGHTTEMWEVSLGGSDPQSSLVMSPIEDPDTGTATDVSAWQPQTLTFTAGSANKLISFLAVGTPNGQPPISLLTGISVQGNSSAVPEPADYVGTLVGMGVVGTLVKSRLAKKKLDSQG
jgi:hypothetical protein